MNIHNHNTKQNSELIYPNHLISMGKIAYILFSHQVANFISVEQLMV